ncbi:nuclear transport factor 2 family protein [Olivibacter domesticus]|uniref:SnoaL-like domain-containing protein n=1 Tax=Olivibacter domesticus TaxID=407022 RepID=A0A1H7R0H8_OLID1|nr:nuclear transport factor 2 family protein [Olivibacter domesticus]SEL53693.1 hypothetical protein SAMN05661044_02790 [Olivibacter domesticus]
MILLSISAMILLSSHLSVENKEMDCMLTESQKNKELILQAFNGWENGTFNFFDLLDDEVIWTVAGRSPVSGTYIGKQDFVDRAVTPIHEKLNTKITPSLISVTAIKDQVWITWTGRAATKKGNMYENHYAWLMTIRGGKIVQATAFLDTYELTKLMKK